MRTRWLAFGLILFPFIGVAQSLSNQMDQAVNRLMNDSQMKHAIMSLYVVNSQTGAVVYNKNGAVGLAAASSQKVIIAATAYELLTTAYRFKTELGIDGDIANGTLNGNLYIKGYGDPTLGSWRYPSTTQDNVMNTWMRQLKQNGISRINGGVYLDGSAFAFQPTPGGWIWDDMGNYYGAGHFGLNWHENQYDLFIRAGNKPGEATQVLRTEPPLQQAQLINQLTTGKAGSGDNAYIYLPPYSTTGFITGTIPAGEKAFKISGAFPDPSLQVQHELTQAFNKATIEGNPVFNTSRNDIANSKVPPTESRLLYTHYSPPLDSLVYWYLKKSINLYGEALLRTFALQKNGFGGTNEGITAVYDFWRSKGIDSTAMKLMDGSGLSPQNRITAATFVKVMQHARGQGWFSSFYNALPEYNGLRMKSGTIGGAKSFTGYAKSANGTTYTFAIIINNFSGNSSQIVGKMYKVLDVLK